MIYEAEERMDRITFADNQKEIDAFREKYGKEFESLLDRRFVVGRINTCCELCMTPKGIQALRDCKVDISLNEDSKWKKYAVIIAVISMIIAIISLFLN
jgi:hypothetical protein